MEYYCECDPHGDNAKCDRPCAKPAHVRAAEAAEIVHAAREQRIATHGNDN